MKRSLIILSLCLAASVSVFAQTRQQGRVREFNSGNSPLAGVQVMAYGAAATDTDGAGEFTLEFSSYTPGRAISAPDVYKRGYELVNTDVLDGWILSGSRQMDVVMAKRGVIEDAKTRYYDIASTNWSRKQSEAMSQINALYAQGEIDAQVRSERLAELAARSQEYMTKLDEYAGRFARINPDDISGLEAQVMSLVNDGKIDEAVELYETSGIVSTAKAKLAEMTAAEEDAEKVVAAMFRYADLCMLAGEKDADLKVLEIYETVYNAFPDKFDYAFKYATQRIPLELDGMQPIMDRCMELAYDDKSFVLSAQMQAAYHNMRREYSKSVDALNKAMECLNAEDVAMPSGDFIVVYMNTARLLAYAYAGLDMNEEAVALYKEVIDQIESIVNTDDNPLMISILEDLMIEACWELTRTCAYDKAAYKKYSKMAYEWELRRAGDDAAARVMADVNRLLSEQARYQYDADMVNVRNASFELVDRYEELYALKPTSLNALQYAMQLDLKVLTLFEMDLDAAFSEIKRMEKMVSDNRSTFSRLHLAIMDYFVEQLYIIYYTYKADYNTRFEHVLKIQEPAAVMAELDCVGSSVKIITAYDYLLQMLNSQRKTQEALELAYKLDAMYSSAPNGYVNTTVVSDVASAYLMVGKYDLALKYLEGVKDYREQYVKEKPKDNEMKINLSSTYNNLAICYSSTGDPSKAYKMQQKALDLLTPFYQANKVPLGQNYFSSVLNLSVYAYQAGNLKVASSALDLLDETAKELKSLSSNYATFPIAASLVRGDFLVKTGSKKGEALVKDALKYKSGSMSNDFVLMWLIQEYQTKGAIYRDPE